MIVVVEGITASGKSTWCARHGGGHIIPETGRLERISDGNTADIETAHFWVELNAARWSAALDLEVVGHPVICDTDPLKLHYAWGLWQVGEGSKEQWISQMADTRQAILDRRIGFADAYIIGDIEPELARKRRDNDLTRRRRNFDLHIRLQPSLLVWYRALAAVLPSTFFFGLPATMPRSISPQPESRYDVTLFDRAIARLPQEPASQPASA